VRRLESTVDECGGAGETVAETARDAGGCADADLTPPVLDHRRYEVRGEIARGGHGRIVIARDRTLDRTVALKELHDPRQGRDRFAHEARVTARLQHPSIIPLYDIGCWPSGEPYYAMRLVSGRPLSEAIRGAASLEERMALLPHVIAAVDAIAYAHSQGVIHRDLKPATSWSAVSARRW
jgi:eukaryotic-like serine/threonine-protein kinase